MKWLTCIVITSKVSRQREYYQKRTLSQERINKLNSIGFTWQLKAGGPKKKRSGGTNDAKITTLIAPKTSGSVEGQNSQDENQTTPAPAEVNKERAENEVAALLTNLRHTSSRS